MGLTLTEAKKNILRELNGNPSHGYILAKALKVRGSTIYEHLEQLEDHGYIESEEDGRRRIYELTKKGEMIIEAEEL
ncbi:winged helix-turn-helix domain-containing protein [Halobiforma nitratireducens]|uniref:ArsR family transcription regulator n=1 Tax=Halobiforma nitratireducens JCM 10879 TaxID=1227454 RepID=M0M423_9EURY|nr:winged helix-turn-helix domain-containing protein [Halobiforma nitratireducens]EMA40163.1 ArsR family transcription regulator [Halobiforma nitratireducens JCM 10879]